MVRSFDSEIIIFLLRFSFSFHSFSCSLSLSLSLSLFSSFFPPPSSKIDDAMRGGQPWVAVQRAVCSLELQRSPTDIIHCVVRVRHGIGLAKECIPLHVCVRMCMYVCVCVCVCWFGFFFFVVVVVVVVVVGLWLLVCIFVYVCVCLSFFAFIFFLVDFSVIPFNLPLVSPRPVKDLRPYCGGAAGCGRGRSAMCRRDCLCSVAGATRQQFLHHWGV